MLSLARASLPNFYPRPPRGGRPVAGPLVDYTMRISIHALREEGDTGYLTIKIN